MLTLTGLWAQEFVSFAAAWSFIINTASLVVIGILYQNAVRSDKMKVTPMARFSFYLISASAVLSLTAGSVALFAELVNKHHGAGNLSLLSEPFLLFSWLNLTLVALSGFVIYYNRIHVYY